jgi:hypothetical protein
MVKTALTAAAALLSLSTLALAQTSTTTPSSRPAAPGASSSTPSPGSSGSGSSSDPAALTGDQIKGALEERGYSNVQVQRSGPGHDVTAMKDGKQVRLNVDPTGRVTQSQ